MKKINKDLIILFLGLIIFFISMLLFVINACMNKNITFAWILFALIIVGILLLIFGIVLYLIHNKEKIKKYFNDILN